MIHIEWKCDIPCIDGTKTVCLKCSYLYPIQPLPTYLQLQTKCLSVALVTKADIHIFGKILKNGFVQKKKAK